MYKRQRLLKSDSLSISVDDSINPIHLVPQNVKAKPMVLPGQFGKRTKRLGECDDNPFNLDAFFSCPNKPCEAKYTKAELLQEHLLDNECYVPEEKSVGRYMKVKYFHHWGSMSSTPGKIEFKTHLENFEAPQFDVSLLDPDQNLQLTMGFALPEKKTPTILDQNQRGFLKEIFSTGQSSNHKKGNDVDFSHS